MIGLLNTDKRAHRYLLFLMADVDILVVMLVFFSFAVIRTPDL